MFPFPRKLIRLVLPIAFQQFMLALVSASDALMLGKLNQDSMAAVSLASQVTFVFNLFMTAFIIGENMFIAQHYGKKDDTGIADILALVLRLSCASALLFLFGTLFFSESIMRFFTDEPTLIALGSRYLKIVGISFPLSAIAQACLTVMKNCNAVSLSSIISSTAVLLNIFLNAVFIFGLLKIPAMSVQGAALATVIATAVQMFWSVAFIRCKLKNLQIHLLRKVPNLARRFCDKTAPILLNELIWGGGFTMYSIIMGHLGADAAAANGVANISKNLIICFCLGLGNAGSILIGNELGADNFEKARNAGKILTKASIICGVLSGLLLLILSPFIIEMTELTPAAKGYLRGMLFISSYYLIGKSINSMTIGGIFPAGGDSRFGLVCDTITLWCITVPLGCLCAFVWKLPVLAIYFVLNLDEIIKIPAVYRHYRKYGWLKNITE